MALEQDALEAIMREHLARRFGVVAELGVELVNFEQSAENVTVHLKKHYEGRTDIEDQTVQAQYLVGADGGRSVVRKKLGLAFLGETRMEDWLVYGNVSLNGLEEGVRRACRLEHTRR
jgi:2-polyprenyl-6-methoxyphenol hydroxylase-like FAD-dependent oxidoreductase